MVKEISTVSLLAEEIKLKFNKDKTIKYCCDLLNNYTGTDWI